MMNLWFIFHQLLISHLTLQNQEVIYYARDSGLIGMIAFGILGIKFFSGIKRLIDYTNFELLSNNGTITLKKRFDTKLIEIKKNESLLELKEQSELMTLKLENDDILSANSSNINQKMTISELTKKLKTVANKVYN